MTSVIVPAYNSSAYLAEALRSVCDQQDHATELILVDDGSTDDTAEIAAQFDLTYIYQRNAGAAAARNRGVAAASHELIAFLDADDLWLPNKLREQAAVLHGQPLVDMVFGHVTHFVSPELDTKSRSTLHCPPGPVPGHLPSTLMARRTSWDAVGALTTDWRVGEFVDWLLRAEEAGLRSIMLESVVARRRLHATNQGVTARDSRSDFARVLKARLDRSRRSA